jgi:hypothetical protein
MERSVTNVTWLGGLFVLLVVLGLISTGCNARDAAASARTSDRQTRIDRGAYLVTAVGCNDCHTPLKMGPNGPEPDLSRMLSGHPETIAITRPAPSPDGVWNNGMVASPTMTAFSGPWGVSFAANLTPDQTRVWASGPRTCS